MKESNERKKIAYIFPFRSSFIVQDIVILKAHFSVIEIQCKLSPKYRVPFFLLKQLFQLITKCMNAPVWIVAFGGYHSLLPALLGKLFGKKVFIEIHGTDAVAFPDIGYGNLRKFPLRYFTNVSYRLAYKLFPVSQSLIFTGNTYYKNEIIYQGVKHFYPELKTPFTVIPNTFDADFWKSVSAKKNKTFITVSSSANPVLKGIDLIFHVAPLFPDYRFLIIGNKNFPSLPKPADNIRIYPFVSRQRLLELYSESSFYLQLSVSEGFGCALCEAMLCGCVPVVSEVNELPVIVGDAGWILKKRDINLLQQLLGKAISDPAYQIKRETARERIVKNYPIKKREQMLLREFASLDAV